MRIKIKIEHLRHRLEARVQDVVFGDEVAGDGVDAHADERAAAEVEEPVPAAVVVAAMSGRVRG